MYMQKVCIYLRKSRADLEAEARGEGETLAKHKKALLKTAKQMELNIVKIREEIASGESLVHRPQMLELLKEVESGEYDAVLVMDMDRLGRGKMQEQGLILETFQKSGTKIITPRKTYDLSDEWDEEYSEFEAFMARKELKIITRRLQGGRIRSVEEGNYIGTLPPYGYVIKELENGRTLEPHPEQAQVVKMIFEWYTQDDLGKRMGSSKIANELNRLGYRTYTNRKWNNYSVLNVLKNAVYAGRLQWKKKAHKKTDETGKKNVTTRPRSEWIDVQGKHEPLISMETFQKAQAILKRKYHVPYQLENGITNPLAGLIRCGHCGSSMVYRPYTKQKPHLKCYNQLCQSKSTRFEFVEERLIKSLQQWLDQYKAEWNKYGRPVRDNRAEVELKMKAVQLLSKELDDLHKQKGRLHDFLERGIYDEETYLERSQHLAQRIEEAHQSIETANQELELELKKQQAQREIIPSVERVLDLYHRTEDPAKKNALLKEILDHCVYKKEKVQKGDDFTLILHPILPQ
jgi:site-specific DNA recombinase